MTAQKRQESFGGYDVGGFGNSVEYIGISTVRVCVKWTGRFSLGRSFCAYRNSKGILKRFPFWLHFSHILEKAENRHEKVFL